MEQNFYDCIDCGTENCPCYLAATGDCLVCSRLAGKDYCDCNWKGVCIYNEFIQSGKKINNVREEFTAKVEENKRYGQDTVVLVLDVGRGFALKCAKPGSYVFLKRAEDEDFYNIPISVMKSDITGGKIHLAVKEMSAKSKRITEVQPHFEHIDAGTADSAGKANENIAGSNKCENIGGEDSLCVRGVYRNGILGLKSLIGPRGKVDTDRKMMIVTKGVGFAPAAHMLEWIDGRARADIYTDTDKIEEELIAEYLPQRLNGKRENTDLRREFEFKGTERISALYKAGGYDTLVVFASDYYIEQIGKILKIDARSNNFRLCCGEGVCGACAFTDDFGRTFKMCKCSGIMPTESF